MSLGDLEGEPVFRGYWLYDGEVRTSVEVVAFDCDYYFDRLPGFDGRDPWVRYPLNADGLLYYVRADQGEPVGFPPFLTNTDAQAWADAQPWAPIEWERK